MIIPFFIPDAGCPHQCVFCSQKTITGRREALAASKIPSVISTFLKTRQKKTPVEVAFYGGSFTALPLDVQQQYLREVLPFIENGRIKSIRVSTRPDCIDEERLVFLKEYHVRTIELGAQSMDNTVLTLAGRGHMSSHTINAVGMLKKHGLLMGLQLMVGLPGDSASSFANTIFDSIKLKPDFVRLYPLLVLKDTPLEALYRSGEYHPLSLDNAVMLCSRALLQFEEAGIAVIRIGLQPTEDLEKPGAILAGPYHPAFRQLVETSIMLKYMQEALRQGPLKKDHATFRVHPSMVSSLIGQKRSAIAQIKKEFGLRSVTVIGDDRIQTRLRPLLIQDLDV